MARNAALLADALALPKQAREELAERLLESVDGPNGETVEQAWDREIVERLRRYDAGEEPTVTWAELDSRLSRKRPSDAR